MLIPAEQLLILALIQVCSMTMAQHFLGLSISPNFITVAETIANRSSKMIAQVEVTDACQRSFATIARKESLDTTAFSKGLQKSLKLAQAAVNTHFNQRVKIPVLALPSTLHDRALIANVKDSMISIGFSSQDELQSMEMSYAAHYAYGLGTAKGLGLERQGVDWDMGSYEALLVEYNNDGLIFSLVDLGEYGCVVRAQVELVELGEGHIAEDARKDDGGEQPMIASEEVAAHSTSIRKKLEEFLQQEVLVSESASNTGAAWKPLQSDIRAVVLAGDASTNGFHHIREVLREVFASLPAIDWLKDEVPPSEMAAIGAAKRAMHLMSKPEDFDVHVQHLAHDHDEL